MPDGRYAMAAVTGKDGRIYTIGGATNCDPDDRIAGIVRHAQPAGPAAQPAPFGPEVVPGGQCAGTQTVRAFDPRTSRWTTLASLPVGCLLPAAAVAPDGRIFVFGCGNADTLPLPSVEVYDPRSNRWREVARLPRIRDAGFAAATTRNGHIDLIGGCLVLNAAPDNFNIYCGDPSPVDAYDPRTNTWASVGLTLNARQALAATTGPDGQVYAVGGAGYGNGQLLEVIRQGGQSTFDVSLHPPLIPG